MINIFSVHLNKIKLFKFIIWIFKFIVVHHFLILHQNLNDSVIFKMGQHTFLLGFVMSHEIFYESINKIMSQKYTHNTTEINSHVNKLYVNMLNTYSTKQKSYATSVILARLNYTKIHANMQATKNIMRTSKKSRIFHDITY